MFFVTGMTERMVVEEEEVVVGEAVVDMVVAVLAAVDMIEVTVVV